jgi:hypothetical protein
VLWDIENAGFFKPYYESRTGKSRVSTSAQLVRRLLRLLPHESRPAYVRTRLRFLRAPAHRPLAAQPDDGKLRVKDLLYFLKQQLASLGLYDVKDRFDV